MRHAGPVRTATFDRSGRHILAAGDDGTVRFWDLTPARALRDLTALPVNRSFASAVNVDLPALGRILSIETSPKMPVGRLRLWDLQAGRILTGMSEGGERWIGSEISLSAAGRRVLLRGEDALHGMVTQILDVRTGSPVSPPIHYPGRSLKDVLGANAPSLSPDGRRYLIMAGAQRSELRDAVTGGVIAAFELPFPRHPVQRRRHASAGLHSECAASPVQREWESSLSVPSLPDGSDRLWVEYTRPVSGLHR